MNKLILISAAAGLTLVTLIAAEVPVSNVSKPVPAEKAAEFFAADAAFVRAQAAIPPEIQQQIIAAGKSKDTAYGEIVKFCGEKAEPKLETVSRIVCIARAAEAKPEKK